jgi:glyoxylase-like metal-dependent hydrolase (beta-lactamase superfamily II)
MVRRPMSRAIDLMHLGRDRVICAFEVGGLVVDPGPASCVDTLLEGLEEEPRALLLTHVHLDHAGAAGTLARRYPSLQVYVHERGAPHIAAPERLWESAKRLYGEDMERLWGEMVPVDRERIHVLEGGETVEDTMYVTYTPGHASHHVSYLDTATGEAYVGDVAGVRLPPHEYTLVPTPPPDIDVDQWMVSVDRVEGLRPGALNLTHFGRFTDVSAHLERVRESLATRARRSRDMDSEQFATWSEAETRAAVDFETAESLIQAAPPEQLGMGLRRYWEKVAVK